MKASRSPFRLTVLALVAALASAACSDTTAKPEPRGSSSTSTGPAGSGSAANAGQELPGIDTAGLTPNEKREFYADLKSLLSPCEKLATPLYQCITEKRDCKACAPAAKYLLKQVREGKPKEVRADFYKGRYTAKPVEVPVTDAPIKGAEKAVVTIVEWADFECPHCKLVSPLLDALVERFPGQVRLAYKFYPISQHKDAEVAARGGYASIGQGKFWEMHHALFDNQGMNDRSGVIKLAKKLGLDIDQFKKDMADDEASNRLERDRKQADDLGLDGTPYVFVNGMRLQLESMTSPYFEDLEGWVATQIEKAGATPVAAPAGFKPPLEADPGAPEIPASALPSAEPSSPPSSAPSAEVSAAPSAAPSARPK
ncbi:MAG: thioredoxin domain-containing protein [Polyangiaceae bacterium]